MDSDKRTTKVSFFSSLDSIPLKDSDPLAKPSNLLLAIPLFDPVRKGVVWRFVEC